jgi:hypothetical protein
MKMSSAKVVAGAQLHVPNDSPKEVRMLTPGAVVVGHAANTQRADAIQAGQLKTN